MSYFTMSTMLSVSKWLLLMVSVEVVFLSLTTSAVEVGSHDGAAFPMLPEGLLDPNDLSDVVDVSEAVINATLNRHANDLYRPVKDEDDNELVDDESMEAKYYKNSSVNFDDYWIDLDQDSLTHDHALLSESHRRAATLPLKFVFPFYGHDIFNLTVATGGFIYTGNFVHPWLAATQYIAPLMANFDTSNDDNAKVRYRDNGTALTVEWYRVRLAKNPESERGDDEAINGKKDDKEDRRFTFQATLYEDGRIAFVYKDIPMDVTLINDEQHPVKVGVSDAYAMDRVLFFIRKKTIYEYHRVDMHGPEITSGTAILLDPLPTCTQFPSCHGCLTTRNLDCKWCESERLCSDGMDRFKQRWQMGQCRRTAVTHIDHCLNPKSEERDGQINTKNAFDGDKKDNDVDHGETINEASSFAQHEVLRHDDRVQSDSSSSSGLGTGVSIFLVLLLLLFLFSCWIVYAYLFPHTWSGLMLIKYRPSQWSRREPRYMAASSVHM